MKELLDLANLARSKSVGFGIEYSEIEDTWYGFVEEQPDRSGWKRYPLDTLLGHMRKRIEEL